MNINNGLIQQLHHRFDAISMAISRHEEKLLSILAQVGRWEIPFREFASETKIDDTTEVVLSENLWLISGIALK